MNVTLMKQPSGFIPIAMSLAALALVLGHIAIFGVVHEADEEQRLISGSCLWLDRFQ